MPIVSGYFYFVHEAGEASRPPVILIHGAGGIHLSWPPQVRRISDQHIFAPDLPGHGKSEGIGRQTIEGYSDDVAAFMDAIQLKKAVMVGHSMGSAIALTLALKHPKRVAGLGLIGGGTKLRVAPVILEGLGNPNAFLPTVQMINENSFGPQTPPRIIELAGKRMAETRQSVLYGDFLACNAFDVSGRLGKITVPTFVMCGTEDRMTPLKNSGALRDEIAHAQLEVVDGAGHMVMLEQPDAAADLISRFMEKFPRRARQKPAPVSPPPQNEN